ncbi:MAG: archaeosortase/exosortase family protein, partial [bacterium]
MTDRLKQFLDRVFYFLALPDMANSSMTISRLRALFPVLLFVALCLVLLRESYASMVEIWDRSQTFTHCYLIIPVSLWLIYSQKEELRSKLVVADPKPLVWLVAGAVIWWVAKA